MIEYTVEKLISTYDLILFWKCSFLDLVELDFDLYNLSKLRQWDWFWDSTYLSRDRSLGDYI